MVKAICISQPAAVGRHPLCAAQAAHMHGVRAVLGWGWAARHCSTVQPPRRATRKSMYTSLNTIKAAPRPVMRVMQGSLQTRCMWHGMRLRGQGRCRMVPDAWRVWHDQARPRPKASVLLELTSMRRSRSIWRSCLGRMPSAPLSDSSDAYWVGREQWVRGTARLAGWHATRPCHAAPPPSTTLRPGLWGREAARPWATSHHRSPS